MYFLLGISLALAGLLVLNILFSGATSILWSAASPFVKKLSARKQSQIVFALRFSPCVGAVILVFAFLLPAYLLYEPYSTGEIISVKLALPALASLFGIILAAKSVFGSWWKTRRLAADWLLDAEPITIADVKIPVYCIRHPFPVIAIVGAFRPKMFIARQIFDSLSGEEFQAAIRHEYGHLAARDNFKRILIGVSRDLLVFPLGKSLERSWTENVEAAADEYAAQAGGKSAALNLASALVKIARIVPPGTAPVMPSGAFLIEAQTADINWRVRYLLRLAEIKTVPARYSRFKLKNALWFYAAAILALTLLLSTNESILLQVHNMSESIVHLLQ